MSYTELNAQRNAERNAKLVADLLGTFSDSEDEEDEDGTEKSCTASFGGPGGVVAFEKRPASTEATSGNGEAEAGRQGKKQRTGCNVVDKDCSDADSCDEPPDLAQHRAKLQELLQLQAAINQLPATGTVEQQNLQGKRREGNTADTAVDDIGRSSSSASDSHFLDRLKEKYAAGIARKEEAKEGENKAAGIARNDAGGISLRRGQKVISGNVVLGDQGSSVVRLAPSEVGDALLSPYEVSYTLTAIGAPMPNLHVVTELQEEGSAYLFEVAGGLPRKRVSWLLVLNQGLCEGVA